MLYRHSPSLCIPPPLTEMNKHGVIEVFRHHNPKSTQILLEQWESSPFQHHSFHRPLAAFRDKSYTICPFHLPCLTFEFCCRVYYSIALLEVNSDFFFGKSSYCTASNRHNATCNADGCKMVNLKTT